MINYGIKYCIDPKHSTTSIRFISIQSNAIASVNAIPHHLSCPRVQTYTHQSIVFIVSLQRDPWLSSWLTKSDPSLRCFPGHCVYLCAPRCRCLVGRCQVGLCAF